MGVASLVLGIIAIVVDVWLGAIMAIIGVVMGALGMKKPESKGIATAGLVLSIVGLALCLIMYAACVACVGGSAALFS